MNPGRSIVAATFLAVMFSTACSSTSKSPILVGDASVVDSDAGQTTEIADGADTTTVGDGPAQDVFDANTDAADTLDGAHDLAADADGGDSDASGDALPPDGDALAPDGDALGSVGDAPGSDGDALLPPCIGSDSCPVELGTGHLQLWLRGDLGVDCVAGRVQHWTDLSPHHNDGAPPAGGWGPVCGAAASPINSRAVVSFPRSPDPIALVSEHIEVDFSALAESALTIAVVEQRSAPVPTNWIIGTPLPFPDQISCAGANNVNEGKGLIMGYPVAIRALGSFWGAVCSSRGETVPVPPAVQASTFVMIYVPGTGISLFLNGKQGKGADAGVFPEGGLTKVATNTDADARPIGFLGRGFIGRGYETSNGIDPRYNGSIAEVVVYNAALDDSERTRLEAYFHGEWNTLTTP